VTVDDFDSRLEAVDWARHETAYGAATAVPNRLRRLRSPDRKTALRASHDLWCGLCHQHAFASSAALPALPFLIGVLESAGDELAAEILDILKGFAVCSAPDVAADTAWLGRLRADLLRHESLFAGLQASANEEVSGFAADIVALLRGTERP